jgi:hypothetical protein
VRWLKLLVIALGVLIVLGFVAIAGEIARRLLGSGGDGGEVAYDAAVALPAGARILDMAATDAHVILRVAEPDGQERLYVIDPGDGRLLGRVAAAPAP